MAGKSSKKSFCRKCGGKLSVLDVLFRSIYYSNSESFEYYCKKCKDIFKTKKEEIKNEKRKKHETEGRRKEAKLLLDKIGFIVISLKNDKYWIMYSPTRLIPMRIVNNFPKAIELLSKKKSWKEGIKISNKEYESIVQSLLKSNLNLDKAIDDIFEKLEIKIEKDKIQRREEKFKIKEKAEREHYGRVKSRRIKLSDELREEILSKYNNKCAICDVAEGLHIHHKDKNPKNNSLDNLMVLCGVCHKKIHMKVR